MSTRRPPIPAGAEPADTGQDYWEENTKEDGERMTDKINRERGHETPIDTLDDFKRLILGEPKGGTEAQIIEGLAQELQHFGLHSGLDYREEISSESASDIAFQLFTYLKSHGWKSPAEWKVLVEKVASLKEKTIEQSKKEERDRLWGELEDIRCCASGDYLSKIELLMKSLKQEVEK